MPSEIESLTKLEAARRQIVTAIALLFDGGDRVSIHTLAAAAVEILRDLGKPKGVGSIIKDSPLIRPEKLKEIREVFSSTQNFLKHADRDPDAVHEFRPSATPFFIFDGCELYGALTNTSFPEAEVFKMWFFLKYPHFTLGDLRRLVDEARSQGIDPDDMESTKAALDAWKKKRARA